MLVACRLAGLSALETYYAGVRACAQFGPTQSAIAALRAAWAGAHAGFSDSGPPLAISSDTRRRRFLHRRLFDRNSARSKRPARLRCRRLASRPERVPSDL